MIMRTALLRRYTYLDSKLSSLSLSLPLSPLPPLFQSPTHHHHHHHHNCHHVYSNGMDFLPQATNSLSSPPPSPPPAGTKHISLHKKCGHHHNGRALRNRRHGGRLVGGRLLSGNGVQLAPPRRIRCSSLAETCRFVHHHHMSLSSQLRTLMAAVE